MKSNKGRKEPSFKIATREKLPLELVAATTFRFLGDLPESRYWDPRLVLDAIYDAIDFLKMCSAHIEANQRSDAQREEDLKELGRLRLKEDEIVPYMEGIKYITHQERPDRARQ